MQHGFNIILTTTMTVREHLARLGENKAPGTDGMGSSFVKNLVGGIETPLVLLFQRSLETAWTGARAMERSQCHVRPFINGKENGAILVITGQ